MKPVAQRRHRIAPREVVVVGPANWQQHISQRLQAGWKHSRIAGGSASPHLDEMPDIAEQPPAAHARSIRARSGRIAVLGQTGDERWKINAREDGQSQRVPEAAVDFHEDRRAIGAHAEFHHRHAVPRERRQHGERRTPQAAVRRDADAKRAAGAGRTDVADSPVRKLGKQVAVPHQGEIAHADAVDEFLGERGPATHARDRAIRAAIRRRSARTSARRSAARRRPPAPPSSAA